MESTVTMHGLIRPLRGIDREPLASLVKGTEVFSADEIAIADELIGIVLDNPDQRDYWISVYEDEGKALGYYCIGPTPGTEGTFDLYWIVVAPEAQGEGIGRALEMHAEDFVRARKGRLLIAETSSTDRYRDTRAFYAHRGYHEVSRIRDYYRPGDDLVVFGKYLV